MRRRLSFGLQEGPSIGTVIDTVEPDVVQPHWNRGEHEQQDDVGHIACRSLDQVAGLRERSANSMISTRVSTKVK